MAKRLLIAASTALSLMTNSGLFSCEEGKAAIAYDQSKPISKEASRVLSTIDTPFAFFKTVGKYPCLSYYNPGTDEYLLVMAGTQKDGVSTTVRVAQDLAHLIPLRMTLTMFYCGKKIDYKFRGYRDTIIGGALDDLAKNVGILPDRSYRGAILVNEYKAAVPSKWVVRDQKDLAGICAYLKRNFTEQSIAPAAQKPVLAITVLNGDFNFNSQVKAFLDNHYEVVDPTNHEVVCFFSKAHKVLDKKGAASFGVKDYTAEAFAEVAMRMFEGIALEFKGEKVVAHYLPIAAASLAAWYVYPYLKKEFNEGKQGSSRFINDKVGQQNIQRITSLAADVAIYGSLVGLGGFLAYTAFNYANKVSAQSAEIDDIELAEFGLGQHAVIPQATPEEQEAELVEIDFAQKAKLAAQSQEINVLEVEIVQ